MSEHDQLRNHELERELPGRDHAILLKQCPHSPTKPFSTKILNNELEKKKKKIYLQKTARLFYNHPFPLAFTFLILQISCTCR